MSSQAYNYQDPRNLLVITVIVQHWNFKVEKKNTRMFIYGYRKSKNCSTAQSKSRDKFISKSNIGKNRVDEVPLLDTTYSIEYNYNKKHY